MADLVSLVQTVNNMYTFRFVVASAPAGTETQQSKGEDSVALSRKRWGRYLRRKHGEIAAYAMDNCKPFARPVGVSLSVVAGVIGSVVILGRRLLRLGVRDASPSTLVSCDLVAIFYALVVYGLAAASIKLASHLKTEMFTHVPASPTSSTIDEFLTERNIPSPSSRPADVGRRLLVEVGSRFVLAAGMFAFYVLMPLLEGAYLDLLIFRPLNSVSESFRATYMAYGWDAHLFNSVVQGHSGIRMGLRLCQWTLLGAPLFVLWFTTMQNTNFAVFFRPLIFIGSTEPPAATLLQQVCPLCALTLYVHVCVCVWMFV